MRNKFPPGAWRPTAAAVLKAAQRRTCATCSAHSPTESCSDPVTAPTADHGIAENLLVRPQCCCGRCSRTTRPRHRRTASPKRTHADHAIPSQSWGLVQCPVPCFRRWKRPGQARESAKSTAVTVRPPHGLAALCDINEKQAVSVLRPPSSACRRVSAACHARRRKIPPTCRDLARGFGPSRLQASAWRRALVSMSRCAP